MNAVHTQTTVVMATMTIRLMCDGIAAPRRCATNSAIASTKELAIAAISLHALIRHQNHRSRYNSPVPAPTERSSSKLDRADSSTSVNRAATSISTALVMRPI